MASVAHLRSERKLVYGIHYNANSRMAEGSLAYLPLGHFPDQLTDRPTDRQTDRPTDGIGDNCVPRAITLTLYG